MTIEKEKEIKETVLKEALLIKSVDVDVIKDFLKDLLSEIDRLSIKTGDKK